MVVVRRLPLSIITCLVLTISLAGCGGNSSHAPSGTIVHYPFLSTIDPGSVTVGSSGIEIAVTGGNFISASIVTWNGQSLTTSYTSGTSLTAQIPSSDLQTVGKNTINVVNPGGLGSLPYTFVVNPTMPPGVSAVNVVANDLAWDPVHQSIYLSLPSTDGANGNAIQALNPTDGTLGASAFVGSEPNLLSLSATGKYLYVSLNGAPDVQRVTLPDLGMDIKISLGSDATEGPFYAMDLQASPVSDGTVAVVRGTNYSPEEEGGVVIYDDGTARPDVLCGWSQRSGCHGPALGLYDSIQWNPDGSEMFAANNETTGFDFYTIPVTSSGFGIVTAYPGLAANSHEDFFGDIHYDPVTQYVYDDNGTIIDPASGTKVGTFDASGVMTPDGTLGKAFFLGQLSSDSGTSIYTLESFDLQTFTPIATLTMPVVGVPTHLIRWGTDGLAFTAQSKDGSTGAVYIVQGSFVDGSGSNLKARPTQNVQRTWKFGEQRSTPSAGFRFINP